MEFKMDMFRLDGKSPWLLVRSMGLVLKLPSH